MAEHKHGSIPTGLSIGRGIFQRTTGAAFDFAPGYGELHVIGSEPMAYAREYRCVIAHGKATVPGINDSTVTITWDAYEADKVPDSTTAAGFAQTVVDAMGEPPGYVLDKGEEAEGNGLSSNQSWRPRSPEMTDGHGRRMNFSCPGPGPCRQDAPAAMSCS